MAGAYAIVFDGARGIAMMCSDYFEIVVKVVEAEEKMFDIVVESPQFTEAKPYSYSFMEGKGVERCSGTEENPFLEAVLTVGLAYLQQAVGSFFER